MRRRRGDHDRDLADREPAGAVLDREPHPGQLGLDLGDQRGHHLDRHRRVGLVLEVIDGLAVALAPDVAGERDDAAAVGPGDRGEAAIERQRLGEHRDVRRAIAAAGDRWNQHDLVAVGERGITGDHVLVHRDPVLAAQRADRVVAGLERRDRVGEPRAVVQLERLGVGADPRAKHREVKDRDAHHRYSTPVPTGGDVRARVSAMYRSIYAVIRRIPKGRIATYGQVAEVAGIPGGARIAAAALKVSGGQVPWQRVLGKAGRAYARIAILDPVGAAMQRAMLEDEGVAINDRGRIALATYGWRP